MARHPRVNPVSSSSSRSSSWGKSCRRLLLCHACRCCRCCWCWFRGLLRLHCWLPAHRRRCCCLVCCCACGCRHSSSTSGSSCTRLQSQLLCGHVLVLLLLRRQRHVYSRILLLLLLLLARKLTRRHRLRDRRHCCCLAAAGELNLLSQHLLLKWALFSSPHGHCLGVYVGCQGGSACRRSSGRGGSCSTSMLMLLL